MTVARPADWPARAAAFSVDVLPGAGLLACLLMVGWSARVGGWLWWLCMLLAAVVLLALALNRLLLPAARGWSVGRSLVGIAVVGRDGQRPGPWQLLLRDVAHLADTLPLFLGWLWPLIDQRRRTFADVLVRTEVLDAEGESRPDWRKPARIAAAAAAGVALAVAALGYFSVYRPQLAAQQARSEVAIVGPKLVTDILSYTATSIDDDFTRAQSLVTERYRPELVTQQDAVRKAGPVDNDYWVTDTAVLSASGKRADMVLLLQGQRGTPPQQRFITASVKVSFARLGPGQWQVDGLTVLAPPKPEQAPAPGTPPAKPPAKPPTKPPAKPTAKPSATPSGKPSAKPTSAPPTPSAKPSPPPSAKPSPKPSPTGTGR